MGGLFKRRGTGPYMPQFRGTNDQIANLGNLIMMSGASPEALSAYFQGPEGENIAKSLGFDNPMQALSSIQNAGRDINVSSDLRNIEGQYQNLINQPDLQNYYGDEVQYNPTQYQLKDIQNVPDEVYDQMQEAQELQAKRGLTGMLKSIESQFGSRGFRPGSGMQRAQSSALGRGFLEQLQGISRDVGMTKANQKLDLNKFLLQQDFARQQAQNAANMAGAQFQSGQRMNRANYLTDLDKYNRNFRSQNLGMLGQQIQNRQQSAMLPLAQAQQNAQNYMTNTMGQSNQRKSIFGSVMGGMQKAGSMFF